MDKNVGLNKSVLVTGHTLSGSDAANYLLPSPLILQASITAKGLSISGLLIHDKVYDGSPSAIIDDSSATKSGLIAGDQVSVVSTGAFSDKNVGAGKTVIFTNQFIGADAGNYVISGQTTGQASITPKTLSVSGIRAVGKVYDGNLVAGTDLSALAKNGLVAGDDVRVSSSGTFSDKQVGSGKTVSLSHTYTGSDVGNYDVTGQASDTASITPKALSISGLKGVDKVYDGSLSAAIDVSSSTMDGLVPGDEVTVASTGTFADRKAGVDKSVALANQYGGADVGNYLITGQASGLASILPKTLSISGVKALDKVYDGEQSVELDVTSVLKTGLVAGDEVTFVSTGRFADKSAGSGKVVTLSSQYSGADLANYDVQGQATAIASIRPRMVSLSAEKTFNGQTGLGDGVVIETGVEGETLSYSGATAAVASVAGPDGVVGTADNYVASIVLHDATDGSGLASNYVLPELNALNRRLRFPPLRWWWRNPSPPS